MFDMLILNQLKPVENPKILYIWITYQPHPNPLQSNVLSHISGLLYDHQAQEAIYSFWIANPYT
jgi:hypothetical protein